MHRVHTENLSKLERRQVWYEIIHEFLVSSQKPKVFCQSQGLREELFRYYLREFKRKEKPSPKFVPIALAPPLASVSQDIRIQTNGFTIHVPLSTPRALIHELLKSVQTSC